MICPNTCISNKHLEAVNLNNLSVILPSYLKLLLGQIKKKENTLKTYQQETHNVKLCVKMYHRSLYSQRVKGHRFITEVSRVLHRSVTPHRDAAELWRWCCLYLNSTPILSLLTDTHFTFSAIKTHKIQNTLFDMLGSLHICEWKIHHLNFSLIN